MGNLTSKGTFDFQVMYGEKMEIKSTHPFTLIGLDESEKEVMVLGSSKDNYLKYRNFDYSMLRIKTEKTALTTCQTKKSIDTAEILDDTPVAIPTDRQITMFDKVRVYLEGRLAQERDDKNEETVFSFNDFTTMDPSDGLLDIGSKYQFDEMEDQVPLEEAIAYAAEIGDKRRQAELEAENSAQNDSEEA